jgi:hypothetical protein
MVAKDPVEDLVQYTKKLVQWVGGFHAKNTLKFSITRSRNTTKYNITDSRLRVYENLECRQDITELGVDGFAAMYISQELQSQNQRVS